MRGELLQAHRRRRRRRRRPRRDLHRRGPRLLRRRRPRRGRRTFDWPDAEPSRATRSPRDGGGLVVHAAVRVDQAADRRDQRPCGRGRGDDDAADGRPAGLDDAKLGFVFAAAGSSPRPPRAGSCRGWWASAARSNGSRPAASSKPTRRLPAASSAACTSLTSCCRGLRAGSRDRRQRGPGLGRAGAADDVAMLGADHPMGAHQADSRALFSRGRSADAARA